MELARAAGLSRAHCHAFAETLVRIVADHLRLVKQKTTADIKAELGGIWKLVRQRLNLENRKVARPGQAALLEKEISKRLKSLSQAADSYLQDRYIFIRTAIPDGWSDIRDVKTVVDPICHADPLDRLLALEELYGALYWSLGKPSTKLNSRRYPERALQAWLAYAYSRATGRGTSDRARGFMDLCHGIRDICGFDRWHPEAIARSLRGERLRDVATND